MECSPTQDGHNATCAKGGRREARREERREAILDVAGASFLEHGYAGTTMSGIASALGGSKGTLWSYYPNKEVLFDAVLIRRTREFREEMLLELNHDGPLAETLLRFCSSLIQKLSRPTSISLHRLVISEAGRFPEVGRMFYERATQPTLQLIAGYLGRHMESGELRKDDPFLAAHNLFVLCTGRTQNMRLAGIYHEPSAAQAQAEGQAAVDVFMRAYAPEPRSAAALP